MKIEFLSLILSTIAILFSGYIFYFTSLRKGKVKMTKPSVIFFGPDGPENSNKKVFIRTLLFSTSQKGNYIQNMYLKLTTNPKLSKVFNIWVYDNDGLKRGSGLYVGEEGIPANHHFLLNKGETEFKFTKGKNKIEIYAELVDGKETKIHESTINLTEEQEKGLENNNTGIYFDWDPSSKNYVSHLDIKEQFNFKQFLQN